LAARVITGAYGLLFSCCSSFPGRHSVHSVKSIPTKNDDALHMVGACAGRHIAPYEGCWSDEPTYERMTMIAKQNLRPKNVGDMNADLMELLQRAWHADPQQRPTARGVCPALVFPPTRFLSFLLTQVRDPLLTELFSKFKELDEDYEETPDAWEMDSPPCALLAGSGSISIDERNDNMGLPILSSTSSYASLICPFFCAWTTISQHLRQDRLKQLAVEHGGRGPLVDCRGDGVHPHAGRQQSGTGAAQTCNEIRPPADPTPKANVSAAHILDCPLTEPWSPAYSASLRGVVQQFAGWSKPRGRSAGKGHSASKALGKRVFLFLLLICRILLGPSNGLVCVLVF